MAEVLEAIYDNGKITFLKNKPKVKRAKVLMIITEELDEDKIFTEQDFEEITKNSIRLTIDPVKFQRQIRDEWE